MQAKSNNHATHTLFLLEQQSMERIAKNKRPAGKQFLNSYVYYTGQSSIKGLHQTPVKYPNTWDV